LSSNSSVNMMSSGECNGAASSADADGAGPVVDRNEITTEAIKATVDENVNCSPPLARVVSDPVGNLERPRDGLRTVNSYAGDDSRFKYDSAKPWYMFGRGAVDKSGAGAGPAWVPDDACTMCTGCRRSFDFFNRKHHCRFCGKVFCNSCSSNYRLLPVNFQVREPQRVCASCCVVVDPMQDELASSISNSTRHLEFDPAKGSAMSNPLSFSMSAEIKKACQSIENFFGHCQNAMLQDQYIPATLLRQAKGIAFLTVVKAGFLFSGRFGTGIVVGHDRRGSWTAPSAIGLAGVGWGAQIGGEVSDFVIILNTEAAVDAFSGKGQVSLGSQIGLAAGPLGRTGDISVNVGDGGMAPCYTYSQSKGLFVGVSLEGALITERADVNQNFYGKHYEPRELLSGRIPRPNAAEPLYKALGVACSKDPDSFPTPSFGTGGNQPERGAQGVRGLHV